MSHTKTVIIGPLKLLWMEKIQKLCLSSEIIVPVYINEDRSDLLFSVVMGAKEDPETLMRKSIAFFI